MKIIKTPNFEIAVNLSGDENATRLAILMPGRLDTKDYINFVKHAELLAEKGLLVVAIDPPFTWDSPGDLTNYTTTNYVKSVNELIEHFSNRPTLLLGHSRGGATAMLASKNPNVAGIVLVNAAYAGPSAPKPGEMTNGTLLESRDLPPGSERTAEQKLFNLPQAYFDDGNNHNPKQALLDYKGPKLVVHATQDEFKPLEEVEEIYADLSEPKMFLRLDCAHDYRLFPEAIEQVNDALSEFVDKYLGDA